MTSAPHLTGTAPATEPRGIVVPDDDAPPAAPERPDAVDGRHARRPGFGWALTWTVVGSILPGSGLVAAGRRWWGIAVLAVFGAGLVGLLALALPGDPLQRGLMVAVDPDKLLLIAIGVAVLATAWVLVVLVTALLLERRSDVGDAQRVLAGAVALALVAAIALPAYRVSDYALITRGIITSSSVFEADDTAGFDVEPKIRPRVAAVDPWAGKPRINVLLIGSDAGRGRIGVRPDTMIVASIDTRSGNTVLLSLPRNLERAPFPVGTPGHDAWPNGFDCGDQCLLNAIWTWAEGPYSPYRGRYKHPGLQATQDAVRGVTGLKIDTYVGLNLMGFREFVEAIGGITVDVHERLPIGGQGSSPAEPYYRQAPGGWIEIGDDQKLNGYRALWFARSRWASDDYSRMERQRCAIGAMVDKADPARLAIAFPQIAKALKRNLFTGIHPDELQAWVLLSQRVKRANVTSLAFTKAVIKPAYPDIDRMHTLVSRAIAASVRVDPAPSAGSSPAASASPGSGSTPSAAPSAAATPKPARPSQAQSLTSVC